MSKDSINLLAILTFGLTVLSVMLIGAAHGGDPRAMWLICDAMGLAEVCR